MNVGEIDAFHPYVLGGMGLLDSDRVFDAVGAILPSGGSSRVSADVQRCEV